MTDGLPNSSCPSIPGPSTLYICEWGHCTQVMNDRRWIKHVAIISRQTLQVPVWREQEKFIIQLSGGVFVFCFFCYNPLWLFRFIYRFIKVTLSQQHSTCASQANSCTFGPMWEKKGRKNNGEEKVTREQQQRWRQQVQDLLFG